MERTKFKGGMIMDNLALDMEIESQALTIPDEATALVINSKESMTLADQFKRDIKTLIKAIDDTFKPLADKAFAAHRAITGKWKETKDPLIKADELITSKAKAYLRKVEEERQAEEIRLRDIARKEEEERRLIEAIELEKEGNIEEAQAVISEPMNIVTPTVRADIPKVDGRLYRTTWKWKVVDKAKIPRDYLMPNDIMLNGIVRSLKGATNISGIQVYEE